MASLRSAVFFICVAVAGLVAVLWFFSDIVVYLVLSMVLSQLLKPLSVGLRRMHIFHLRMPRTMAVICAFLVMITVIGMIIWAFLPIISTEIQAVSRLDYHLLWQEILQVIQKPIYQLENFLIDLNFIENPGSLSKKLQESISSFFSGIKFNTIFTYFLSITEQLFISILSIVFITFVLLYEEQALYRSFIAFIPNRYFEMITGWLFKIERSFVNYLTGLSIQVGIIFTLVMAGLFVVDVKYAPTIALFAGLANLIPYLGPLLGAFFAMAVEVSSSGVTLLSYDTATALFKISMVFLVVQLTDNFLVQPIVFSRSVQAHPMEIFLVIFMGATLGGIMGMIFAIPSYTILKLSITEAYKGFSAYHFFRT